MNSHAQEVIPLIYGSRARGDHLESQERVTMMMWVRVRGEVLLEG